MTTDFRSDRGFSLTDMLMTVALVAIVGSMATPLMTDITSDIRVAEATRLVERELQDARLRAVSSNRTLRVRTNCPATGFVRTVEFLNSTADTAANRCSAQVYPYPAADTDIMTRPNFDGPVRTLPAQAEVATQIIEFLPNGTAYNVVSNVAQPITTPVTITVTRLGKSKAITINAAGKIQVQ